MLPRTCPKIVLLAAATLALCAPPAAAVGFGTPSTVAADNSPQHVAVGEFNGDSDPDLAVVNQSSNNVSILLGAAGGTFTGPVNYPVGLTPLALAVADFNGDSDPDLAVANEAANTVSVLLGGAGGTFSAPTDFAVGSTPQAVAARDFNGDSDPDLAVVNEGSSNVSVLLGGAGGSFAAPANFGAGGLPRGIAVDDFNGDSDPDLAVANEATNNVSVLLGAAGGGFTGPTNFGVCSAPTAIATGEFSGDSDPDLVVANELCHNVSVLAGAAGGTFTGLTNSPVGNLPDSVAVAELNGDSDRDLAVANQGSDNVSVLVGGSGLAFVGPIGFPVGDSPTSVATGDFNGDGRADLAVTNELTDDVSILLATGLEGHPRPKSASPLALSLAPAYNQCPPGSANRTHGPALEHPSCAPPVQTSGFLTVGTPDANSAAAQSIGSLRLRVCLVAPCGGGGTAPDVVITASLTDVRNKAGLGDYAGELQARFTLRLTDRANGGSLTESATLGDRTFAFTLPCSVTGSTSIGSTCAVSTRANALVPGIAAAGNRAIWQATQVEVLDGGSDGDVDTASGNTVFARQGVFVP